MKKILIVCICLSIMTLSSTAHTVESDLYHHVQCTGWDVYEDSKHWGGSNTIMTVSCGDFDGGSSFGSYIENAVDEWDSSTFDGEDLMNIEINNSSGAVVFLDKTSDQMSAEFGYSAWAVTYRSKAGSDSNNHYYTTSGNVEIWVNWTDVVSNKSSRAKTHVPLHELGHVIGLKDVPASVSPNAYLMCNEFGTSYSVPNEITATDKQGAAFILGQHVNHVYESLYIYHNSYYHRQPCSKCGAYKLYSHNYINGTCTLCGHSS